MITENTSKLEQFLLLEAIASYDVEYCPACKLFQTVSMLIALDETALYYCSRCGSLWPEVPVTLC